MVALVWDKPDERIYYSGLDRGVFYPTSGAGVVWNGLISVDETFAGEDSEEYFFDGIKYFDKDLTDQFEATIEAFSVPQGFHECEGQHGVGVGLYLGNQPKARFGFSYRTKVEKAISGVQTAPYEIHVVYNALIVSSGRSRKSLSDAPEAEVRKWSVRTVPVYSATRRVTAHFVIKAWQLTAPKLAGLEATLYGTSSTSPSLPTQDYLISYLV